MAFVSLKAWRARSAERATIAARLKQDVLRARLAAYGKAGFADPPSDFGPYAYDAANVFIGAFARVLAGKNSIPADGRAEVVAAVQATRTSGATGRISFDKFGDTTNRAFTLYRVQTSKGALDWVPVKP